MNPPPSSQPDSSPLRRALRALESMEARLEEQRRATTEPIAITGLGCRFPGGANSPLEYWQLLESGRDAVSIVPPERWDAEAFLDTHPDTPGRMVTRHGGFLSDIEGFDPAFFGISPREAARMDPQHRLLLEVAWEALDAAGQTPNRRAAHNTGVFVGITGAEYASLQLAAESTRSLDTYYLTGNALNTAAGRISFVFGLEGPALAVDTACSSSLTAVHLACQSLRRGECDSAIALGVNALLSPIGSIALSRGQVLAPSGRARTFDAKADGMVRGEGCGAVVLKRLSDAQRDGDAILAVIRGSAVNQDGPSSGLTVPHRPAQARLLRDALATAGLSPDAVDYVEAHGTGTPLGDPIEVGALADVFAPTRTTDQPLQLGSVKTNFGHLESAAGIAGLIKTVLSLHFEAIPPHLHLTEPSPHIDWHEGRLKVPVGLTPWKRTSRPRIAGVSSFGFSGTNAHVVLEESPTPLTPDQDHHAGVKGQAPDYRRQRFPLPVPLEPDATTAPDLPGELIDIPGDENSHFEFELSENQPAWIHDHQVFGKTVFPAAAWLEIARRAGAATDRPVLSEGRILRALALPENRKVTLHTVVKSDGTVDIFARNGSRETWRQYFSGKLTAESLGSEPGSPPDALSNETNVSVADLYQTYGERGLNYGPAFQGMVQLQTGAGGATAQIQLPAEVESLSAHAPHPAILDACFQAAGHAFESNDSPDVVYLPVSVGTWELFETDADFTAPLKLVAKADAVGNSVSLNFTLFDENDRALARLDKLGLQQASAEALARQFEPQVPVEWLYTADFVPSEAPTKPRALNGDWLIVSPPEILAESWQNTFSSSEVNITIADEYKAGEWRGVIFCTAFNSDSSGLEIETQLTPTLQVIQQLGAVSDSPELWLITPPPASSPLAAAVWGLVRAAQAEWPHLTTRVVGMDGPIPDQVFIELIHADRENQILRQAETRRVLRLRPSSARRIDSPPIRPDQTYLITGGRGALGILTAKWLIAKGARHLALVGRSKPNEEITALVSDWGKEGIQVANLATDLSAAEAGPKLLAELSESLPPIAGVIHVAGVIADATLDQQTPAHFRNVAEAKIEVAYRLADALSVAGITLDFWINYSSSAAVLGTPGQANYAAANAWLDAFPVPSERKLTVAWGPWTEGMGAALGDRYVSRGISGIKPEQAFALLEQLLSSDLTAAAVLPIDWRRFFNATSDDATPPLLALLRPEASSVSTAARNEISSTDPRQAIRQQIARTLRLDLERLEDDRPLTLQGLDSLMAMELRHAIQKATGLEVPVVTLLGDLTLQELVASLTENDTTADTPTGETTSSAELSRGQAALWFLHQSDPTSAAYHTAFALNLTGPLNPDKLKDIFGELVHRHPQLRARFPRQDGTPTVLVSADANFPFEVVDATGWSEAKLKEQVALDYAKSFDLERDSLFRITLYQQSGDDRAVLLCTIHHIISDAWTNWLLLDEFRQLYAGTTHLPSAEADYTDFVAWQKSYLTGSVGAAAETFWCNNLSGPLPQLALPLDYVRPAKLSAQGASVPLRISSELFDRLKRLAKTRGTTAFTLLLSAWQVWLHRHTGQKDIIVGSPTAGRSRAEFTKLAGYFVNPVPFRAQLDPQCSFTELLENNRNHQLQVLQHADYPLPLIVEKLKIRRDPSRPALFQNLFVYQKPQNNDASSVAGPQTCGDLLIEEFPLAQMEGQFELTLEIFEGGGGALKYNTALFSAASADRFSRRFQTLLESIADQPETAIDRLTLIDTPEREQVTTAWLPPEPSFSCEHTLAELLTAQALRTPDTPAVSFADQTLTYRELHERAQRLAGQLQAAGVGPDVLVGICAERSIELVVGLLGISLAGGGYVPFDPSYPADRLQFMHEDSGVQLMLVGQKFASAWSAQARQIWILEELSDREDRGWKTPTLTPNDAAYLIYTSGSTGQPKGALNTHRGIVNRLEWMQSAYPIAETDTVLQKTPFSFDVSVWEFFWPLLNGAKLVLARPGGHQDPTYLIDLIRREQITTLHFVPSMLQLFADVPGLEEATSLRRIICSGEALPEDLPARIFRRHPTVELHNLYGPTEAAVDVTYWACQRDANPGPIPIGRPVARTPIYILDEHQQPQPIGVPGELHIGGVQLMRGYHQRPELNAEKLIQDPFGADNSARLYRTGDLASWRADGVVEYLGRMDGQIKLRGFRIELGEIETALTARPAIRDAVVLLRQDRADDPQLTAYLIPQEPAADVDIVNLRADLRQALPEHMVPNAFVSLSAWPLSPSGKLDRAALPKPEKTPGKSNASPSTHLAAKSESQKLLAALWQDLLGHTEFGLDDNFFDLGGHSLHLGKLQARLHARGFEDVELVELFQFPTIRTLADRLQGSATPPPSSSPPPARPDTPKRDALSSQRARRRKARNQS